MVPRRPLVVLVSVSVVLVAIVAAVLSRSPADPAETPAAGTVSVEGVAAPEPVRPASPAPFTFRWPAGTVYTYALSMEANGTVAPVGLDTQDGQAPLSGSLALHAEIALRSYGRLDDRGDYVLGVQLARLTRLDWTLGQQPVLADGGDSLTGREVALVVSPDGTFRSVNVGADDSPFLVNLLRDVLGPLQVVVSSDQRSWTTEQESSVGEVRVAYEVREDGIDRISLQRRPLQYTRLVSGRVLGVASITTAGAFDVVLDRAGHLDTIEGDERVSADRADGQQVLSQDIWVEARLLSVTRVAGGPGAAERLASLESTGLDDVAIPPDIDRRLLEQRVGDLTMDQLVDDLFLHGPATEFPDAGRWMWQATGLLLLHPELCRDLVDVFEAPRMNRQARARILDLLASTGNPEAQAVLCELLETPEANGSERYGLLVQRLSLVEEPTRETLDYLRARVEQGDGEDTLAAAHALGAAIGNRARAEGEVDDRSAALLRQGLAQASSADETVGWLGALGNAGLPEDVSLVAGYAADDDPTVRSAVAGALRKMQSPDAEATLLGLVADPDPDVQGRALHTLTGYAIDPTHLDALRRQVASGRLGPDNFAMLITLLERNRYQPDAVVPVLDAMLEQDVSNRRLLLRIRALHEDLSSDR